MGKLDRIQKLLFNGKKTASFFEKKPKLSNLKVCKQSPLRLFELQKVIVLNTFLIIFTQTEWENWIDNKNFQSMGKKTASFFEKSLSFRI